MLLQHEVGNNVPIIAKLNSYIRKNIRKLSEFRYMQGRLERSEDAVRSMQRLADLFSPLANRTFWTRRRNSRTEIIVEQIASLHEKKFAGSGVDFEVVAEDEMLAAIDPGELAAIIDNLTTNALYWLEKKPADDRKILVEIKPDESGARIEILFHDSGPGVDEGDEEKIFWPGVTRKEGGIGMGLTVASELVAQCDGKMSLIVPGRLGGASFRFDLPRAGGKK